VNFRRHLMLMAAGPLAALSLVVSFSLRFDFSLPANQYSNFYGGMMIFALAKLPSYYVFERQRRLWSYVGLRDLLGVFAVTLSGVAFAITGTWLFIGTSFPASIYFLDLMVFFILTALLVFSPRLIRELVSIRACGGGESRSVLIYGAGTAGLTLAREIRGNRKLGIKAVGFLDDDPFKAGASLAGLRVLGTGYSAAQIIRHYSRRCTPISEIIIAIPSANKRQMREVIANCRATQVPFRTVPSLSELLEGRLLAGQIREVSVDDLLGRDPVTVSDEAIAALQAHDWPGNVRQLRNIIERTVILAPCERVERIEADMLPSEILENHGSAGVSSQAMTIMGSPLREARESFEREYLRIQIRRFSGNISRTASFIGMERSALHRKLKALGIGDKRDEE